MIIFLVCEVCLIVNLFPQELFWSINLFSPTNKIKKAILLNDCYFF